MFLGRVISKKTMPVFDFAVLVFAMKPLIPMVFRKVIIKVCSTFANVGALITPVKLSHSNQTNMITGRVINDRRPCI